MAKKLANPKQVAYSIILRDARGFATRRRRKITWAQARIFDIYYGKKLVLSGEAFPGRAKKVSQKKNYLTKLLSQIEENRLQILSRRREKAKAKKEVERVRLKEKTKAKKKKALTDYLSKERLNEEAARYEESQIRSKSVLAPVKIVPVKTGTKKYKKDVLFKKVRSDVFGDLDLKILDYTMKSPVELDEENKDEVKEILMDDFRPHLNKFFKESARTRRGFIFRIKFDMRVGSQAIRREGIGGARFYVEDLDDLLSFEVLTMEVFDKLASDSMIPYLVRSMGGSVNVTGFTIENIIKGKFP